VHYGNHWCHCLSGKCVPQPVNSFALYGQKYRFKVQNLLMLTVNLCQVYIITSAMCVVSMYEGQATAGAFLCGYQWCVQEGGWLGKSVEVNMSTTAAGGSWCAGADMVLLLCKYHWCVQEGGEAG